MGAGIVLPTPRISPTLPRSVAPPPPPHSVTNFLRLRIICWKISQWGAPVYEEFTIVTNLIDTGNEHVVYSRDYNYCENWGKHLIDAGG